MRVLSNQRVARACFSSTRWVAIAMVTMVAQPVSLRSQTQITTLQQTTPAPASASAPPVIQYQNGQLTIEAHNSRLSDVLRAVSKQTGAEIEFPPEANQPVAAREGPGPAVEVLDRLLRPLGVDYGIVGSAAHPNEPVRVLVLARPAGSAAPRQVPGPPPRPASTGAETAMTGFTEDPPSREALEQLQRTIHENLIGQRDARGRQPR